MLTALLTAGVLLLPTACGNGGKEKEGTEETNVAMSVVEQMPMFPGGPDAMMQYFQDNIVYPEEAIANSTEGRVVCKFVVKADGSIADAEVLRGVDPLLDAEAVRVIEAMPKWTPGKVKGEAVDAYLSVPVVFRLK